MPANLHSRIMDNGTGWYWEIVTETHEVLARGVADTRAEARAESVQAAQRAKQQMQLGNPFVGSLESFNHLD